MTDRTWWPRIAVAGAALWVSACAPPPSQFDRYYTANQWPEAARAFALDGSLRNNEAALYHAGVVYGTPGRPPYDPTTATELLSTLVTRFPNSKYRGDATARLLFLGEVVRLQHDADARAKELEAQVASLTREVHDVRARLDASTAQSDSLRGVLARVEADRREREDQLRSLRLELQRLMEIDLKPRRP
jgi:hypothetical protein